MSTAAVTPKLPDPAMYDNYEVEQTKESSWVPPPVPMDERGKAITFTLTAPPAEGFQFINPKTGEQWTDRAGFWMCVLDGCTVETEAGLYTLGWEFLSSQPFNKYDKQRNVIGKQNRSSLGNYFRACGLQVRPTTEEEYKAFLLATAGVQFRAQLDWRIYDPNSGGSLVNSYRDLPNDPNDQRKKLPFIETDNGRRWVRASIKRFIDAVGA